jgi:hypothetical protein
MDEDGSALDDGVGSLLVGEVCRRDDGEKDETTAGEMKVA